MQGTRKGNEVAVAERARSRDAARCPERFAVTEGRVDPSADSPGMPCLVPYLEITWKADRTSD